MSPRRFSDFSEEKHPLEGEKKKLEEILNIEILITGYRIRDSRYKERKYITPRYKKNGGEYIPFTGSEVLQKQIEKYNDKIPFYATIKKINKYYTLLALLYYRYYPFITYKTLNKL